MSTFKAAVQATLLFAICLLASLAFWSAVSAAQIPQAPAVFETSLRSRLTALDTSMTLVSNEVRGDEELSGYHCFTLDEGRSDAEFVCGTVSGTTVSSLERGISFSNGTTSTSTLIHTHRVGASVKVTDFPLIQRIVNVLTGIDGFISALKYNGVSTSTLALDGDNLASVAYVNAVAFDAGSVVQASEVASGFVELATGAEAAAGTETGGTGARLALGANLGTSTCQTTGANVLVSSSTTGKLDGNCAPANFPHPVTFAATSTFTSDIVYSGGATVFGSTTIKTYPATSTAHSSTYTWTKPAALKFIIVEVQDGGSAGEAASGTDNAGAGGAGGPYSKKLIPASALGSTETITVGNGAVAGGGGSRSSSFGSHVAAGSANGDVNIPGQPGSPDIAPTNYRYGGMGGDSFLGHGGAMAGDLSSTGTFANNASGWGGGGSGAARNGVGAGTTNGGQGGHGIVIVTEVYY